MIRVTLKQSYKSLDFNFENMEEAKTLLDIALKENFEIYIRNAVIDEEE